MQDETLPGDLEMLSDLDRIRDQTLDLDGLCRGFAEYLCRRAGFDEAHVLVRDPDSGGIVNPAPDRPVSDDVMEMVRRVERSEVSELPEDPHQLALPLAPRGQLLGLLALRSFARLSTARRSTAELAASMIDSSLEHALVHDQLQQRSRELEAVFALDRLRDEHLPFDQMIDQAARKILEFIPADAAAVVLFNEATDLVDIRLPSDPQSAEFGQAESLKTIKELAFRAFGLRSLVSAERLHPAIGSALCVPLILDQNIIGAFVVIRRRLEPFGGHARRLLAAMASQIDTAIFEDMQRQRIKNVFTRYVAADVVEEMLKTDCDFFAGQRRELSVLFSDLRGFTAASERLDTDTLVGMLNQHLSAMCRVVLRNRGTLDKFIGDCVMAFWGAPVEQPDHAYLAVKTAVEMRSAHEALLADWRSRGLPPIHIGIGINSGEVFVGNIGDERKSSYTVIGDHVNLASRLEGIAQGGQVLISDHTRALLGERAELEPLAAVRVKGKSEPVGLFNVVEIR